MRVRALLVGIVLAFPAMTGALTLAELQAQVQLFLAQIAQMEGTVSSPPALTPAPTGPLYSCITLTRSLLPGDSGNDVAELQRYLSVNTGIYPEALVTGFYGPATERAVQRWQSAHGIISAGNAQTTGWGAVGMRTRAAMANCNTIVAPGSSCPVPPSAPLVDFCMNGTWSKVSDAKGCHVDWKCSGTYIPPLRCPSLPAKPSCGGTLVPVNDATGCVLDWKCTTGGRSCPVYRAVTCSPGYELLDMGVDTDGCKKESVCTPQKSPFIRLSYPPAGATYIAGQTVTLSWDSKNVPSGAIIQFDLLTNSGALVGDGVMRGCDKSSNFSGTCTWKIPKENEYGYCLRATDTPGICVDDFPSAGIYKVRARIQSGVECRGYCVVQPFTIYASGESGVFTIVR